MKFHWYKNASFDLSLLVGPNLIPFLVLLIPFTSDSELSTILNRAPIYWWFLFQIFFDGTHIWSTIYRSVFDKHTLNTQKKSFWYVLPLIAFIVVFIFGFISEPLVMRFLFYAGYYHAGKQLFGIISLYRAKLYNSISEISEEQKSFMNLIARWDRIIVNILFYIPFIFWHFNMVEDLHFVFRLDPEMLKEMILPSSLHTGFWGLNWTQIGEYSFYLLVGLPLLKWISLHLNKSIPIQPAKIIWLIVNVSVFSTIFYFNSRNMLGIDSLIVTHAIPYIALVAVYRFKLAQETENNLKVMTFIKKSWFSSLLVFMLAFTQVFILDLLVTYSAIGPHLISEEFHQNTMLSPGIRATLYALMFLPNVTHYLYDAYIWRFGKMHPKLNIFMFN
ncbi:MAG: hypothetical protein KC493_11210 [Bacteriovoracaceae bacterium]|nr:hypothetical protein [Bacteriovoracaceae bacterium]